MDLFNDRETARVENAQDLFEFAAPAQDLAPGAIDGILALPVGERRFLLDPPCRVLGMPTEDRENGDILFHADGIVAGLSRDDEPAIDIEDGLHLGLLESNPRFRRQFARKRVRHVVLSDSRMGRVRKSAVA